MPRPRLNRSPSGGASPDRESLWTTRLWLIAGVLVAAALVAALYVLMGGGRRARRVGAPGPARLRDHVRRANRRIFNPVILACARRWRGNYPAIVHHVGRRSGKHYTTPVIAHRLDDGVVIPLPYGTDMDWLRNVLARGACTLEQGGHAYPLTEPEIVAAGTVLHRVPLTMRLGARLGIIRAFVRLRRS